MNNIVISRSQQNANKCVMGDTEATHTGIIADKVEAILSKDPRLNVLNIPLFGSGDDMADLRKAVTESNAFISRHGGKGYHLEIHTDAGAYAQGCSGFYFSEGGFCFGRPIWDELTRLTPTQDGIVSKRTNLHALNKTMATAFLIEVCFHDSLKEAQWLHANFDNIAKAIVKGVYRGMDIEQPVVISAPPPPETFEQAIERFKAAGVPLDYEYWNKSRDYYSFIDAFFIKVASYLK